MEEERKGNEGEKRDADEGRKDKMKKRGVV